MDLLETGTKYRHPWELSRIECVIGTISPYLKDTCKAAADIGCGDLFFSERFAAVFTGEIFAVDTGFDSESPDGSQDDAPDESPENQRGNGYSCIKKLQSIEQLADSSIDIAILMDVLEHVENQKEFLSQLSKKLSEKAVIFITAPAFSHLFSEHDSFLRHFRRYNKKSLSAILTDSGFKIERLFYFYSTLYIIRLVQFIATRPGKSDNMVNNIAAWNRSEESKTTRFMQNLLNLDFRLNRKLGRLSFFGLSLFAVCSRRGGE